MIRKITEKEIDDRSVAKNLADRPSQKTLYGGRSMTPQEIKQVYDILPKHIAERFNEFIDSIPGVTGGEYDEGSLAAMILTGIRDGHTLKDLFEEIKNGTFKGGTDGQDGKTPYIGVNGNWWIGTTDTGVRAEGKDGDAFHIVATFSSIAVMQAGHKTDIVPLESYVLIDTGNENDEDYGKVFIKKANEYVFVVDMTGPIVNGKDAYEIALENGFQGSKKEWLESLKGKSGVSIIGAVLERVSDDTPTLITFTIDGVTYQAENGMTWNEWTDSDYNADGFWVDEDTSCVRPNGDDTSICAHTLPDGIEVKSDEEITASGSYTIITC